MLLDPENELPSDLSQLGKDFRETFSNLVFNRLEIRLRDRQPNHTFASRYIDGKKRLSLQPSCCLLDRCFGPLRLLVLIGPVGCDLSPIDILPTIPNRFIICFEVWRFPTT